MRANEFTPASKYPLPILPNECFQPITESDAAPTDLIHIRTTDEQFQRLSLLGNVLNSGTMDVVRGAIRPYLNMYFDRENYYDIPLVDELPQGKKLQFVGRLAMTDLWRLSKLTRGIATLSNERFNRVMYSANELFFDRVLQNYSVHNDLFKKIEERKKLLPMSEATDF